MTPKVRRPTVTNQRMLSVRDVAELLNVSESLVYKLVKTRQLKAVEVGGLLRFWPEEVEEYAQSRRTMPGRKMKIRLADAEEKAEAEGVGLAVA